MSSGRATEMTGALPMADARYVKAKTCVWWDIENCPVPRSCDPYSIAQNISKSLADLNYKGVVTISAYGDTTKINTSVQQALSSTGVALNHVPTGIKDASDKKILVDMLIWGYDNHPPANHLLISGDRDFSNALHQLSMRRYNILLAQPERVSQALVSAAKTVWLWSNLVVGGRPFEKLPNFYNTSTNSKSNFVTESNNIVHPSQPDDFNLKNNNNGNSYNGNKAKQISKTQSQPIINASSSKGNENVYKQSLGSFDSFDPSQENDLKHPNYMSVSTTAELGSNCITGNNNSTIMTESNKILCSSQPDGINNKNNDNGNFGNHGKEEQICKTQSLPVISTSSSNGNEEGNKQSLGSVDSSNLSQKNELKHPNLSTQPVISTSSSNGNEEGNKQSLGSVDSSNLNQTNELKHPNLSTQPEKVSHALVSAAKTVWQWTSLVVGGRPVEKIIILHDTMANSKSNNEMQGNSILHSTQPDDLNQKSSNNGNFDHHSKGKLISESQSQPCMISSSSNGNVEGSKLSTGGSDSSSLNQMDDSKALDLGSNYIPKSQQSDESGKKPNAPCGPTSNHTPEIKQKEVSNATMSTTNGSGALAITVGEMTKVDKNSTLSQPSALVPESGNPYLSTDPTYSNIQLAPDMVSSNHKNELIQPSHAHEAKGGKLSTLPESNSSNVPNNIVNTKFTNSGSNNAVKFVIKKNRKTNHKREQNPCPQSCHQYTHSSSAAPTIIPNDYQSVPPTIPDVSSSTPIPDISASSSNGNGEYNKQSIGSPGFSDLDQKNDSKHPSHTFVLTVPDTNCITSNSNPTPCIPISQQVVDSGKPSAPCKTISNRKPIIKQKGGNISNISSSDSAKFSTPVLPGTNRTNVSKNNVTVKIATKGNRKKNYKQQKYQSSQSCFQYRNLSGSNYNHNSSSTLPTFRPNNYQDVLSAMPNVSPSTPIHVQIGFILEALNILKSEKISPTEANISDCIRYGSISIQNFNVKMSLDYAVNHQVVVMHKLGNCMPLYVGRNDTLWNCVNIMDSNADQGTENLDAVLNFLSSADGRSAILSSQCRYQAALILRESCMKNIVLGEILQLLHIIIQSRKWIVPHASGWQPLTVTVSINSDEVSASPPFTNFGWD